MLPLGAFKRVQGALPVPSCLWQLGEPSTQPLLLSDERHHTCVKVVDASQLPYGRRLELCPQLLDLFAELPQSLRAWCGSQRGLRACRGVLLYMLLGGPLGVRQLAVIRSAGLVELFDREVTSTLSFIPEG